MPGVVEPPPPAGVVAPKTTKPFPAGPSSVAVLAATALVVLAQLYAAIPLLGPVGSQFGGNATFALATVYGLCYAVGFLLWGPAADRYGHKRVMVVGLAIVVATTLGCAFATSLHELSMLRGAQGLAAASFAPIALAYLSESVAPRWRAMAIGWVSTAFLIAGILGQVVAQAVAEQFGWAWMFAGSAALLAVSTLLIATFLREPRRAESSGGLARQFLAVTRLLTQRSILFLCAAHLTLLLTFVAMYTSLGAHLATLGHDADKVFSLRLVALPGMFTALASGPLARVLGGHTGLARAGYLLAAGGLVAQALRPGSLTAQGIASLLFVSGIALAVPAMIGLFGEAAAPQRASGMALNGLVLFTGASIGPIVASAGLPFPILLVTLAALLCGGAVSITGAARVAARTGKFATTS